MDNKNSNSLSLFRESTSFPESIVMQHFVQQQEHEIELQRKFELTFLKHIRQNNIPEILKYMAANMVPLTDACPTLPDITTPYTEETTDWSTAPLLSQLAMYELMPRLASVDPIQTTSLLSVLSRRKERVSEILGALEFTMDNVKKITAHPETLDVVGTGGDKLNTFNISTAASLIIASTGIKVAKCGGKAVSSLSGSSDVISALSISKPMPIEDDKICKSLAENNYVYLWAPLFHEIWKPMAPIRQQIGTATIFNILGPISNPVRPKNNMIGVYRRDLVYKVLQVLIDNGSKRAMVLHAENGMDEISLAGKTLIVYYKDGKIEEQVVSAETFGLPSASLAEIEGGSAAENAKIIESIFNGEERGAKLNVVLANAAAGLFLMGKAASFTQGIEQARNAVESGKARTLLASLKDFGL